MTKSRYRQMKNFTFVLIAGSMLAGTWPTSAPAHSWDPKECCNNDDCMPVEAAIWVVPVEGGEPQLVVSTKRGKVAIPRDFPARQPQDGRMHVCMGSRQPTAFSGPGQLSGASRSGKTPSFGAHRDSLLNILSIEPPGSS